MIILIKSSTKGSIAAAVSNTIFGLSFLFSKTALNVAHPLIILSVRFAVAFIFMSLLIVFRIIKVNYKGKNLKGLFFMALAQPFFYFIFEIYGIKFTSSSISGIIIALIPVISLILSVFILKEVPTKIQVVCTIISLISVSAISILQKNTGKNYPGGIALLFLAALCSAVFNLLSRKESGGFSAVERTYFMFLVSAVGFNILAPIVLGGAYTEGLITAIQDKGFIISILFLSIISSCITFLLYNYATGEITITRATAFANISTIVSVVAGMVVLHEQLSVVQLILCGVILLGVFGVNYYGK